MEIECIGAHFRANQKDLSLQQTLHLSHSPACHKDLGVYFTLKVSHLRSIFQLSSTCFAKVSCSHHWSLSNLGKTGKIRFPWAESWDMKYPDDVALACSRACLWLNDMSAGLRMTGVSWSFTTGAVEVSGPIERFEGRFDPITPCPWFKSICRFCWRSWRICRFCDSAITERERSKWDLFSPETSEYNKDEIFSWNLKFLLNKFTPLMLSFNS